MFTYYHSYYEVKLKGSTLHLSWIQNLPRVSNGTDKKLWNSFRPNENVAKTNNKNMNILKQENGQVNFNKNGKK